MSDSTKSRHHLSGDTVEEFNRNGAIVLRGVFTDWMDTLRNGVEQNLSEPGEFGKVYTSEGETGKFFGDYCNWQRIDSYRKFFFESAAGHIAAQLVDSSSVRIFHEHVLVKEPGTARKTPWHHDQPYYCVDGSKLCSLWIPLDPVDQSVCAEFICGSHSWNRSFLPTKFSGVSYDRPGENYEKLPDIDAHRDDYNILSWELEPGDAIAFHFMTVHGAPEIYHHTDDARFLRGYWVTTPCTRSEAVKCRRRSPDWNNALKPEKLWMPLNFPRSIPARRTRLGQAKRSLQPRLKQSKTG